MVNSAEMSDVKQNKALDSQAAQAGAEHEEGASPFAGIHEEMSSKPTQLADASFTAKPQDATTKPKDGTAKPEDVQAETDAKNRALFQSEVEHAVLQHNQFGPVKAGQTFEDVARILGKRLTLTGQLDHDLSSTEIKQFGNTLRSYNGGEAQPVNGERVLTASKDDIRSEVNQYMQKYDKERADEKQIAAMYKDPALLQARKDFAHDEFMKIKSETFDRRLGPAQAGQSYEDMVREHIAKSHTNYTDDQIKNIVDKIKDANGKDAPAAGDMVLTRGDAAERKEFLDAMDTYDKDLLEFRRPAADIHNRFETKDIEKAFQAAKDQNVPLIVQFGAYWCPHCNHMTKDIMPQFEGTAGSDSQPAKDGSLNGKAIFLHLDAQSDRFLQGDAAAKAKMIENGAKDKDGSIGFPTYMVFAPDDQSKPKQFNLNGESLHNQAGEMTKVQLQDFLKAAGIK